MSPLDRINFSLTSDESTNTEAFVDKLSQKCHKFVTVQEHRVWTDKDSPDDVTDEYPPKIYLDTTRY